MTKATKPQSTKTTKKSKKEKDPKLQKRIDRYLPYLEEIQKKLLTVAIIFSATTAIGFARYQQILNWIMKLFNLEGINLVLTSPYQFLGLAVNTGVALGFAVAIPLLGYYTITFLKPALRKREYDILIKLYPISFFLFVIGFGFGVWVVQFVIALFEKTTVEFAVSNLWDIGHFFSQIMLTGTLLALIFQLPIIMTALIRLKVVKHSFLVKQRRYIYAILLLIGALLPPTDIVSLILLTVPPLFLFELALLLNKPYSINIENKARQESNKK